MEDTYEFQPERQPKTGVRGAVRPGISDMPPGLAELFGQPLAGGIQPFPGEPEPKCPQCGYVVIGLTSSICPECGGVVSWSRVREEPEYLRQERLARIQNALYWVGLVLFVSAMGCMRWWVGNNAGFFVPACPLLLLSGVWYGYRAINDDDLWWGVFGLGLLACLFAVGIWALT
jgi:hypothetical protein